MSSTAAAAGFVAEQRDKSIAAVGLYGLEVAAANVQITNANKTRFYILSAEPPKESGLTRAVPAATCEAGRIDDVIAAIHETGLELISLHDRPEGSALGSCHYVIEAESLSGMTEEQISAVRSLDGVRFPGCFRSAGKPAD